MKILLAGDSFAADWNNDHWAWWKLLSHYHDIVNTAQAGCSEYRILNQIRSVNLDLFDLVIISHTSPYRVYVQQNPLHKQGLHCNSDLIFSDVEQSPPGPVRDHLMYWFTDLLDLEYACDIYTMIRKEIATMLATRPTINLNFFQNPFNGDVSLHQVWKKYPGTTNHMNREGNDLIFKKVKELINDIQSHQRTQNTR